MISFLIVFAGLYLKLMLKVKMFLHENFAFFTPPELLSPFFQMVNLLTKERIITYLLFTFFNIYSPLINKV